MKRNFSFIITILTLSLFLTIGCKKDGNKTPVISTVEVTQISQVSAVSGGDITDDGGSSVTVRGVCWSTNESPTIADNKTEDGTGTGSFTSQITGLNPATTYYVRAYAINTAGTAYGAQFDFTTQVGNSPTVTTASITNITASSATGGGIVTQQGSAPVTQRGVVWNINPNPTIADNLTNDGSRTGPFTSQITGLNPATTYYVRAYAINKAGPDYGAEVDFITLEPCAGFTPPFGYEFVSSSGKCWLDRNLGASRVAQSSTDAKAYGDLYQWGRLTDGHQNRTSGTTSTLSNGDVPGHGNFITGSISPYDWRRPQNSNLWQGVSSTNNPCPSGYRLPTEAEWNAERLSWGSNDAAGAFSSPLKLPVAGERCGLNGSISNFGFVGSYWSATVDRTYARYLYFHSSSSGMDFYDRGIGNSVRCLKD